jgi:YD repeat-containing protein
MNRNKLSTLAVFALLASLSCSKNDPVVVNGCLLTKITSTVSSGATVSSTMTDVFEYDSDRRLVKITETTGSPGNPGSSYVQTYTYVGGMVAGSKTDGTAGGTTFSINTTWTNVNGRVTKITDPDGLLSTFAYDGGGNLKTYVNTDENGAQTTLTTNYTSDLQSVKVLSTAVTIDASYASHDSKTNPYTLLAKAINQPYYVPGTGLINTQYLHKANPLSEKDVLTFGGSSTTLNVTFIYDYNARGYPVKCTQVVSGFNQTGTILYEYKDCN